MDRARPPRRTVSQRPAPGPDVKLPNDKYVVEQYEFCSSTSDRERLARASRAPAGN